MTTDKLFELEDRMQLRLEGRRNIIVNATLALHPGSIALMTESANSSGNMLNG
jgi:hypothetical protein